MKVLLLRPYYGITIHGDMHGDLGISDYCPAVFPDISLVNAATIAKMSNMIDLDVVDANAEKLLPQETTKRLQKYYDTIIIKAAVPTIKLDIDFAKKLKKLYPNTKVIMAGHVIKLIKNWLEKNIKEIDEYVEIPLENYIVKLLNKDEKSIRLNDFPSPDYTLFPYKKYIDYSGVKLATLQMSRGCSIGCAYCPYVSFYGKKIDYRTPQNVINDIKNILKLGINYIQFRDQYFTFNRKIVTDLCNMIIEQDLKFQWCCETKIESLDNELIDLMVRAGMKKLQFGVESASKETLKTFKRPTYNAVKIRKLINYLNTKNVETVAFYMIGFPDDTWDSIQDTYRLSTYIKSTYVKFFIYTPIIFQQDNDSKSHKEISPDLFVPFSYTTNESPSKHLTMEELEYLSNQLSIMYHSIFNSFEGGYKYHYLNQNKFQSVLEDWKNKNI